MQQKKKEERKHLSYRNNFEYRTIRETSLSKKMLQATAKGIEFSVKVVPHSQKEKIVGWENQHLKIRLHAAPEKNKANEELIEFLSSIFDLSKAEVQILHGHTSRLKKILLTNISLEEANDRISKNIY